MDEEGWEHKKLLATKYDATSAGYDDLYKEEQMSKYGAVIGLQEPAGVVLDDGCGTALLLEYLAAKRLAGGIAYYVCLDISAGMLARAKRRLEELASASSDAVQGDAEHLPIRSKAVDLVYSFTVFSLLPEPLRGLQEARRVARKLIVFTVLPGQEDEGFKHGRPLGKAGRDKAFVSEPG